LSRPPLPGEEASSPAGATLESPRLPCAICNTRGRRKPRLAVALGSASWRDGQTDGTLRHPFDLIFGAGRHRPGGRKVKTPRIRGEPRFGTFELPFGADFEFKIGLGEHRNAQNRDLVGETGFEPATPCSQNGCLRARWCIFEYESSRPMTF
jgi:hypothetical protein